jgi:lipid II:glycine glycyltransferase (peptidoglycan interpeptide bridge formation enzyme)
VRYELIDVDAHKNQELKCFLFTIDNRPAIIMPFYLSQISIEGKTTEYFDVSSPWGYMGPLLHNQDSDQLPTFWKEVDNWYDQNKVIAEFIRFNFQGNEKHYNGTVIHTLSNIRGRLRTEEAIWQDFKRSVRKNYKTAKRNNLICRVYQGDIKKESVEEFYAIWKGTMKRHEAADSYYHTFEYFFNYITSNEDCCALATVYDQTDKAISTELLLLGNDTMYSFLGGTDASYFHLRPNDLLKIEAMNWARSKGLTYYILGGGLKDGDTLYQYKKKYFPEEPEIHFYTGRKILNHIIYGELCAMAGYEYQTSLNKTDLTRGFFPLYRSKIN